MNANGSTQMAARPAAVAEDAVAVVAAVEEAVEEVVAMNAHTLKA